MSSRRRKKKNRKRFIFLLLLCLGIVSIYVILLNNDGYEHSSIDEDVKLENFVGKNIDDILEYGKVNDIDINISYEYNDSYDKNIIISQNIDEGVDLDTVDNIEIVVSLGSIDYNEYGVNELGKVPIMMYHGIVNMEDKETKYIGGNVDRDGYNRTSESFRSDLEFYYNEGYRMIRLNDYIDGNVDVELGKSPVILTFDDGNENNFKVLGKDSDGNLIIDPDCAVGILEEYKKKYPDYGVTATFFVNASLFEQEDYNKDILNWLVDNGYDIGNHTINHVDFKKIDSDTTIKEVGGLYKILDDIIPGKYVNIMALPFGSPYNLEHSNYAYILKGNYNGFEYNTKACLRVGWEAEVSCYHKDFNPSFLKRIRAYDNNGMEFDIEMNFNLLDNTRYISDGIVDTVVVPSEYEDNLIDTDKKVIVY